MKINVYLQIFPFHIERVSLPILCSKSLAAREAIHFSLFDNKFKNKQISKCTVYNNFKQIYNFFYFTKPLSSSWLLFSYVDKRFFQVSLSLLSGYWAITSDIEPWQQLKIKRRERFLLSFHFFWALSLNHLQNFFCNLPIIIPSRQRKCTLHITQSILD